MSKRRRDEGSQSESSRSRPRRNKKHLYVALDDWEKGFTIHKISLDSGDEHGGLKRLPEPAALRIKAPVVDFGAFLVAMGSEILMAAGTNASAGTSLLVYDTETAAQALSIGPRLPPQLLRRLNVVAAVGEMVYVLSTRRMNDGEWHHSFKVMSRAPAPEEDWSWESVTPPPPFCHGEIVASYAVHPDKRTIFMTTRHWPGTKKSTYSFDTKLRVWRWHGEWALPFEGRGYFNNDLDAWVGLHDDGYICSCKVVSRGANVTHHLDWTMAKERLFSKDWKGGYWKATLACMGRNKFCLVESVNRKAAQHVHTFGEPDGFVLHLTVFSLEYDNKKGELHATVHHPTHSYVIRRHTYLFPLEAFWM